MCQQKLFYRLMTVLLIGCLMVMASFSNAEAQYRKRVIIHSGQAAPGTNGAVFSTESWQVPTPVGISQSGRVLFNARLDEGVGDATSDNSSGLWATDADSVRLVARVGGAVPGQPGMLFLKSVGFESGGISVYMDPNGQIGLSAEYSSTGERGDEILGFFAEENGVLDLKVWEGMELLPAMPGVTISILRPIAFNAGRFLFSARIEGTGISRNNNDLVVCEYGSWGISVIARKMQPMPFVGGDYITYSLTNIQRNAPLNALGGAIIQIDGRSPSMPRILGAYYWTPEPLFVPMAFSNQDSSRIFIGNSRMNSVGGVLRAGYSWVDGKYKDNIWTGPPQLTGGSRVVMMGDVAPGSGGATFANYRDFVLFDNNQIAFNVGLSDNGWGIWMGDASGLRKVAMIGDPAPGLPGEYNFTRVNWMIANRAGKVAFLDFATDMTGWGYDGIWIGDADGLEVVSYEDEQVEIAPGDLKTIVQHYIGHTWWTSTGADGYASQLNDADELAFGVSFKDGTTALLFGSPGLVVNSAGDAPDADKTDGVCDTGNLTPDGKSECTLRAAIQELNAGEEIGKIRFRIPYVDPSKSSRADGAPSIQPNGPLPDITKSGAKIDATGQPGGRVEISGLSQNGAIDGLVIKGNSAEIRGLRIVHFGGNGINIQADSVTIADCQIGVDPSEAPNYTGLGNDLNGILINGSFNTIGGPPLQDQNVIALNKKDGLRVESGRGNSFRRNHIFANDSLGIELFPRGVHVNDTLDADAGANDQLNMPIIDSVTLSETSTIVYGMIFGKKNSSQTVQVYYSPDCDASGAGEGKDPVDWGQLQTDDNGFGKFTISTRKLEDGHFITATATDEDNSTSEFSYCWPQKIIEVVDAKDQPIKNKLCVITKVANDRPNFTETKIVEIETDDEGKITLTEFLRSGKIHIGDSIRVKLLLNSSPHLMRSVSLDNAGFDSLSYRMSYDTLDTKREQKIKLDHTIMGFTIVVDIQWDASQEYLDMTEDAIRHLANYLYDVYDGQVQIDTARIHDWVLYAYHSRRMTGIFVAASNSVKPYIVEKKDDDEYYPVLPRRWFGPGLEGRNLSLTEKPLNVVDPTHYRTIGKYLARRMFWLFDEAPLPGKTSSCNYKTYMGFMGSPYGSELISPAGATEISWSLNYSEHAECKTTRQFREHGQSCWDFLKGGEGEINGVFVPITRPNDRYLPSGAKYFYGPNSDMSDLDHDVGAKVIFPVVYERRKRSDKLFTAWVGKVLKNAKVTTWQGGEGNNKYWLVKQGRTDDNGDIILMGVADGDSLKINGRSKQPVPEKGLRADTFTWYYILAEITTVGDEPILIEPSQVYGNYPLVCGLSLGENDLTISLHGTQQFQSLPSLDFQVDSSFTQSLAFVDLQNNYYSATFSGNENSDISLTVKAPDDSSNTFFFTPEFNMTTLDSTTAVNFVFSQASDARFILDSTNMMQKAGVLSSAYPVMRGGMNPMSLIVSDAYGLGTWPSLTTLTGDNFLTINYDGSLVSDTSDLFLDEQRVRIFYWNETSAAWEFVGGVVDTALNEVTVPIYEAGVYVVFTTDMVTDIADENNAAADLPENFAVAQNYPNPFNPSTVISYSLPTESEITITVYNILGRQVKTLVQEIKPAGQHSIIWDGSDDSGIMASSGVYFYRLTTDGYTQSKKMILLK